MNTIINKSTVSNAIIDKVNSEGSPNMIRAKHLKNYETPKKIPAKDENMQLTPYLAVFYDNGMTIYQIELEQKLHSNTWEALSNHVQKEHGNFYIVVPSRLKEMVKEEIDKKSINANLLFFTD